MTLHKKFILDIYFVRIWSLQTISCAIWFGVDEEVKVTFKILKNREKLQDQKGRTLTIKYLSNEATEDKLRSDFSRYGEVVKVSIVPTSDNSKSFGLVTYKKQSETSTAIFTLTDEIYINTKVKLNFYENEWEFHQLGKSYWDFDSDIYRREWWR